MKNIMKHIKKKMKKKHEPLHHDDAVIEDLKVIHEETERDGKIIFLHKHITPSWLIAELNSRFRPNKDKGSKCGILPA
jgi:hypothetical protein